MGRSPRLQGVSKGGIAPFCGALHKKCRVTRITLRQAQGERCISIYVRGEPACPEPSRRVEPRPRNATFGAKPFCGGLGVSPNLTSKGWVGGDNVNSCWCK